MQVQNENSRISTPVPAIELNKWKRYFKNYGTKMLFEKETGVTRQTLYNILSIGRGEENNVSAIRNFYTSKSN